ncbi:transcription-repair coupling factor [gut metagenome]|uniref:Transcription-repair coupling factor n=1 Tax=gut metagenome TaxID=749906 RepID=J9GSP8_9ZZZZ
MAAWAVPVERPMLILPSGRDKVLTDVAAKRLSAIREFTSFGSGFRIAMRDLQIRGAGSLLGQSQHGHMQAVGYELYMKILNSAVAMAKGETPAPDKGDCLLDLSVDAFIPEKYISSSEGRIEAYKRIAAIENAEDAADVLDELIDRYGDVPKSVSSLVEVSLARVTAARLGFSRIVQQNQAVLLYAGAFTAKFVRKALEAMPGRMMFNNGAKPYLTLKLRSGDKSMELINRLLSAMEKPTDEKEESKA